MRVVKLRRAGILLRTLLIATPGFARSPRLRGVSFFLEAVIDSIKKVIYGFITGLYLPASSACPV